MTWKDGSYHYSGEGSRQFWGRVNRIKDQKVGLKIYTLGCKLQNLEEKVLAELQKAEKKRD